MAMNCKATTSCQASSLSCHEITLSPQWPECTPAEVVTGKAVKILSFCVFAFVCTILTILVILWWKGCPPEGFQCKNGPCILKDKICDEVLNCPYGDDESETVCIISTRKLTEGLPNVLRINSSLIHSCHLSGSPGREERDLVSLRRRRDAKSSFRCYRASLPSLPPKSYADKYSLTLLLLSSLCYDVSASFVRNFSSESFHFLPKISEERNCVWDSMDYDNTSFICQELSKENILKKLCMKLLNTTAPKMDILYKWTNSCIAFNLRPPVSCDKCFSGLMNLKEKRISKKIKPNFFIFSQRFCVQNLHQHSMNDSSESLMNICLNPDECCSLIVKWCLMKGQPHTIFYQISINNKKRKRAKRHALIPDTHLPVTAKSVNKKGSKLVKLKRKFKFESCDCDMMTRLYCSRRNLSAIPDDIQGNVTWLVLNENQIKKIEVLTMRKYQSLSRLHLDKNLLTSFESGTFQMQQNLKVLFLSENKIHRILEGFCEGLSNIRSLYVDWNRLHFLDVNCFSKTPKIETLDLSHNRLSLRNQSFPAMDTLVELYLHKNRIRSIGQNLLKNLKFLKELTLQDNLITTVETSAFSNLISLRKLDLSKNHISSFGLFQGIPTKNLKLLNLRNLPIVSVQEAMFFNTSLTSIYFPRFRFCSLVPQIPVCRPEKDGISDRTNMLGSQYLKGAVWVMTPLTLLGNSAVLLCRTCVRSEKKIHELFIKNLAVADLLMGIYLCCICILDILTRENYFVQAPYFTSHSSCSVLGMLAFMSCESSVFTLTLMSVERYLSITQVYLSSKFSSKFGWTSISAIWITSFLLSVFPILWIQGFYNENSLCFPLHISEPYAAGWRYTAFIFIGLNLISITVIIASYAGLFININWTRRRTPLRTSDAALIIRFFFIVLTDVACLLPVIITKVAALMHAEIPDEVYGYLVVLVLPINSAINPFLYTFTAAPLRKKIGAVKRGLFRQKSSKSADVQPTRFQSSRSRSSGIQSTQCHSSFSSTSSGRRRSLSVKGIIFFVFPWSRSLSSSSERECNVSISKEASNLQINE